MTQKEARDLQIDLHWKQLMSKLQESAAAQDELLDRLERVMRPNEKIESEKEMEQHAFGADLCPLALEFVRVRNDIANQLRRTVDVLERLEL
jgi:hypothetical protein